ncbi:MAG: coproporphyrinogen III oxidase family protein [Campylobacteraceae bacterium]|nr:coproporphyrinogen III oxidase family protein [Campylobacteraceae bacterium]
MNEYFENKIIKLFSHFINFHINKYLHANEKFPPPNGGGKKLFLYIHVPFCTMFCPYCSFHKFIFSKQRADDYFKYLKLELLHIKSLGCSFERLIIGGGSPLLCEDHLIKTIEFAKSIFSIRHVSCESDPARISTQSVKRLKGLVDRLSVGVQTFDDELLKITNRYDKFGSGLELAEKIRNITGILPITSVDIIFNFPSQTKESLMRDIEMLKKLSPEQASLYPLMVSSITKNSIREKMGAFNAENEKLYFHIIKKELQETYPIKRGWSFMKKQTDLIDEYAADKNEYIGAGAGAFSFLDGRLHINEFSLDNYAKSINRCGSSAAYGKSFSKKSILYYGMLNGLYGGSMKKEEFKGLFCELAALKFIKAVKEKDKMIVTTPFGDYLFMNAMKEFYIGMDKIREKMRLGMSDKL